MTRPLLLFLPVVLAPALLLGGCATVPETFRGPVIAVPGPTTLTVRHQGRPVTVRLHGVQAPRLRHALGRQAKGLLVQLALERDVRVVTVAKDRRGRTYARVIVGSRPLAAALLRAGLAWTRARHPPGPTLARLEAEAIRARRGVWAVPLHHRPGEQPKARAKTAAATPEP